MPGRTILFRLMLWSLGLAAATGVLAVLFQGGDLVWRIVGTGLCTAAACGLLIPASSLVDRERTRRAGLLAMSMVIFEYLAALGLIWEVVQGFLSGVTDATARCILTMVLVGLATPIFMIVAQVCRPTPHYAAAVCAGGATFVALALFLIGTWLPGSFMADEEWWGSGGTALLLGLLTCLSLLQLTPQTRRTWRWLGIASALIACLMLLDHIWVGTSSDLGFVAFCGLLTAGCICAHANASLIVNVRSSQRWIQQGTILFAALTGLLVVLIVAKERFPHDVPIEANLFERLTAACGIIAGCGTLALLVLARMNRKVDAEPGSIDLAEVTLFCPRCRKKHAIPIGDSKCPSCGLRISLRVEEPRCAHCDYLLRDLTSDRCPECGTPIVT